MPPSPEERAQALTEYKEHLKNLRVEFPNRLESADFDEIDIREYEILEELGRGGFAIVYKGRRGDQFVAIKAQEKAKFGTDEIREMVEQEPWIMFGMDSNLICQIFAKWEDAEYFFMMMGLAPFGDLYDTLYDNKNFSEEDSRAVMSQIVCGLEYIHACNILYRDMKPENCLMYENGRLKISDFGMAVVATANLNGTCGTPDYCAPEVLEGKFYNDAMDWWSAGAVMYELNLRRPPFSQGNGTFAEVARGVEQPLQGLEKSSYSDEWNDLIRGLLEVNPDLRLGTGSRGVDEVKQHPWFKSTDWYNVLFGDFQFENPQREFKGKSVNPNIFKDPQRVAADEFADF